ncbi:hypothetical protein O3P69_010996 [Scylla paramamosain]|uniref:Uncharacterized protein n=1 Tax=Scylla paramamosain TaxID=85552 RepID=A0AAW0SC50_SCYPA
MMTFDMNLALESVEVVKDKQVLLASGGETLDSCKRVCHYSAGTDSSPIFLFSKVAIEGAAPQPPLCSLAGTATSGGREEKVTLLYFFEEDLKLLARIPVFPELLGKTQEEEEISEGLLEQVGQEVSAVLQEADQPQMNA